MAVALLLGMITALETRRVTLSDTVALAVPLEALLANRLPLDEAFVLSRVVLGEMPVRQVVGLCARPETEVIAVLGRLLRAGLIQL